MKALTYSIAVLACLPPEALSLGIPSNIRDLYESISSRPDCSDKLATGFYNSKFEGAGKSYLPADLHAYSDYLIPDMSYCGDHLEDFGIIYLQGPGKMANMDVDCDGDQGGPEDDGRCDDSSTTIPETAVRDVIEGYNVGIRDLNPHEHSFVVFGNSGAKKDWATFDPQSVGIEKSSIMAVVCGDQMVRSAVVYYI